MVQIVENWSRIAGRVEGWEPPAQPDTPGTLIVRVERIGEVASQAGSPYANLLAGNEGRALQIQLPSGAAGLLNVAVGDRIELDVRRGRSPDNLFARPDRITTFRG
jgi:hypothetical protein